MNFLEIITQRLKVIYLYILRLIGLHVSHEEMYLEKLKINAYKGDPKAQYQYGIIIIRSKPYLTKYIDAVIIDGSIARNAREALEFIKKAANQGHEDARYALGEIYEKGTSEIAADEREALIWYEKAGYQGHPKAQIKLIEIYKEGKGTRKDIQQSQEWEERAEKNIRAEYKRKEVSENTTPTRFSIRKIIEEKKKKGEDPTLLEDSLHILYMENEEMLEKEETKIKKRNNPKLEALYKGLMEDMYRKHAKDLKITIEDRKKRGVRTTLIQEELEHVYREKAEQMKRERTEIESYMPIPM